MPLIPFESPAARKARERAAEILALKQEREDTSAPGPVPFGAPVARPTPTTVPFGNVQYQPDMTAGRQYFREQEARPGQQAPVEEAPEQQSTPFWRRGILAGQGALPIIKGFTAPIRRTIPGAASEEEKRAVEESSSAEAFRLQPGWQQVAQALPATAAMGGVWMGPSASAAGVKAGQLAGKAAPVVKQVGSRALDVVAHFAPASTPSERAAIRLPKGVTLAKVRAALTAGKVEDVPFEAVRKYPQLFDEFPDLKGDLDEILAYGRGEFEGLSPEQIWGALKGKMAAKKPSVATETLAAGQKPLAEAAPQAAAAENLTRGVSTEPAGVAKPLSVAPTPAQAPVSAPRAATPPQPAAPPQAAAGGAQPPQKPPTSVTPPEPLPTGKPGKSLEQADEAIARFSKFLTSPETENAWDMTVQLRKEALGQRVARFQARADELVVQGKSTEEAVTQATRETMSGTLPSTTADLTTELRDALFAKVYHTLQAEPFEMISTSEALTNALLGKPIPRIPGTAGGSAYTRLLRVFGDTPDVVERLTKGKKIEDLVEEAALASAKKPLHTDAELEAALARIRQLPTIPSAQTQLPSLGTRFKGGVPTEQGQPDLRLRLGQEGVSPHPPIGEQGMPIPGISPRGTPLEQAESLIATVRATYPDIRTLPGADRELLLKALQQTGISEVEFGRLQLRLWPDVPTRPIAEFQQLPNLPNVQTQLGQPEGRFRGELQLGLRREPNQSLTALPSFGEQAKPFGQLSPRGTPIEQAESLIDTVRATYPDIRTLPEADRDVLLQTLRSTGVNDTDLGRLQLDLWPSTPPRPVPTYEAPIEAAIKQPSLMPEESKHLIIRALKEAGLTSVDIGGFMRANLASVDFSWWRQAAPLIPNNKRSFIKGNVFGWRGMWDSVFAKQSYRDILNHPLYTEYDYLKLDFLRPAEMSTGALRGRGVEEFGYLTADRPIPAFTAKLPHVKVSQRGFVTGINAMLWDMFENHYRDMLKVNEAIAAGTIKLKPGRAFSIHNEMRLYGKMLEEFSGRASLGKARELGPAIGNVLFAPRLALGRLISPRHMFSSSKYVRAAAWKNAVTFVGGFGSVIAAGNFLNLWDVEWDPRSSDFAKIRIGNTRIDPWGGYQQFARFYAQVVTNTGISGVTGAPYKADPLQSLTRFLRGKAAPLAGMVADFKTGKTYVGDNVNLLSPKQWTDRLTPLLIQDIYDAVKDAGPIRGAIVAGPGAVGAGVSTYGSVAQTTNRTFNEAFPSFEKMGVYLGEVASSVSLTDAVKGAETKLTPQQRDKYQQMTADIVIAGLQGDVAMLEASNYADSYKKEVLQKRMAELKAIARDQFREELIYELAQQPMAQATPAAPSATPTPSQPARGQRYRIPVGGGAQGATATPVGTPSPAVPRGERYRIPVGAR